LGDHEQPPDQSDAEPERDARDREDHRGERVLGPHRLRRDRSLGDGFARGREPRRDPAFVDPVQDVDLRAAHGRDREE